MVMHMFGHLMFSSPNAIFVDKIFHHQLFLFYFLFYIKLWGDDIILSPKALYGDKLFHHQLFSFYFLFFY